jgi:hypothetical protein
MATDRHIQVPAPQFELHELVILHWNTQKISTRIARCWYRLDSGDWWYQVAAVSNEVSEDQFFPENAIEPR